jgi:hypothetical protein
MNRAAQSGVSIGMPKLDGSEAAHASGERAEEWTWSEPVSGYLADR